MGIKQPKLLSPKLLKKLYTINEYDFLKNCGSPKIHQSESVLVSYRETNLDRDLLKKGENNQNFY